MRTILTLAAALALTACAPEGTDDWTDEGASDTEVGDDLADEGATGDEDLAAEAEAEDLLLFMREEEKLARDVYDYLDETWGSPRVFASIEQSEQSHMDALRLEIERLGLTDPIVDDSRGVFTDPLLADLYVDLTAAGSASIEDALGVGALIEDLDIVDLQEAAAGTSDPDLSATYESLECGSRNHLRAFTSQLDDRGVVYEPQFLSAEAFDAIVSGAREQCD